MKLPEGNANSGFMFRAQVEPNKVFGYQAEVDSNVNRMWSGGLYDESRRGWFISPKRGDKESEKKTNKRSKKTRQLITMWNYELPRAEKEASREKTHSTQYKKSAPNWTRFLEFLIVCGTLSRLLPG